MQQRPYNPPIRQVKKTRVSHTLRAVGLGLAFSGLDYLGYEVHKFYKMFKQVQPEEMQTEKKINPLPPPAPVKTEQAEFNREDILKALEKTHGKNLGKDDRLINSRLQDSQLLKSRFLENFIYGCVLVKIGKEARSYIFENFFKSVKLTNKLLLSFPIPILSYYGFCNFYEGKSLDELIYRLQFDFFLLYAIRIVVANFERQTMFKFEKLSRNVQLQFESQDPAKKMSNIQRDEIMKSAMKKTTFSRNMISGVWVFMLTYMYKYPIYNIELEKSFA